MAQRRMEGSADNGDELNRSYMFSSKEWEQFLDYRIDVERRLLSGCENMLKLSTADKRTVATVSYSL